MASKAKPEEPAPNDDIDYTAALNHAWKYFELHANQRMTLFNFFSAFSGLIVAGIGATLQASSKYAFAGAGLGLVLTAVSLIFWKLDQRASFLVKHAEDTHASIEAFAFKKFRLFTDEPEKYRAASKSGGWLIGPWTYGQSFRLLFSLMGLSGFLAAGFSILRLAEIV
ncbi:hypothetical protein HJB89_22425 [Rhizobium sp. NZLR8]|uniref:hypothetical protein n=1 Tax=Rhizobium sp. NZLR8 TaxID=2731104 RepID=UPI001C83613C|nr:hypothetical protein [Rhizobium sp. NZLR8]MBX5159846.1 hypothetical protein [Rhizobium sp. NZLR8]